MQEKTWYYEKWVGRQAAFSPSQNVKGFRGFREFEEFKQLSALNILRIDLSL